ncbi:TPA: hypothetical protein ACKQCJ_004216 [Stenotrophomonas maltophilia]|jgi:hypothetical protein|uniref:Uncharacterized protein n=1 Tax=Stenotrophomonas maltophilia TaxID=40324 RepID=A0AAI9CJC7_STEMA|nr:hypothetical protein [Stenotrophomonas maltophilia]EKU9965815.1 hypothetical protein [Stenotrophomonas maltophilia]EKZ1926536.1 hypothetical protein [Stenotrophomonas maltophilia]ELE7124587.1 hypothetical protein [Stenotrophomonas maltophilia]EMB2746783.1 hypothetical protein [Stenotrophomonas maltophilia]MBH1377177.1 hypothetical protein [Stenotrophomonas maltophilia]
MQESIALPDVYTATAAIAAAFHLRHLNCGTVHELEVDISSMPGHVTSFVLDFAGGNYSGVSILQVESIHRGPEPQYVGVVYGEVTLGVFLYDPDMFTLTPERDDDADYDSGQMVTADPQAMGELDAFGLFFQLENVQLHELASVDFMF